METKAEKGDADIGILGLFAVLFIGLKLTGYIDWSWWWVLGPVWLPLVIGLVFVMAFIYVFAGLGLLVNMWTGR